MMQRIESIRDTAANVSWSRMDSIRCIIASAVLREWKLHQFDAVTAFLHGDEHAVV
jgi:hypothetical protein